MKDFFAIFTVERLISSLVIVVISAVVYCLLHIPLKRSLKNNKKNKGVNTYLTMISSIVRYVYFLLVLLLILQVFGVNITTMLAGVGLLSAVAGLALQDTLRDIIRGISLVSQDYFRIGDYVEINGKGGTVISSGIRSTKLCDPLTGDIITLSNRNIDEVKVAADLITLDVPLPYELPLSDAEKIMHEIVANCKKIPDLVDCEYRGVEELAESAINYRLHAKVAQKRLANRRAILHVVLETLEKHHLSVPYPQLDLHRKN